MQLVSSRIWTRVAVCISYDGNHYTTPTSSIAFYCEAPALERVKYSFIAITLSFTLIWSGSIC